MEKLVLLAGPTTRRAPSYLKFTTGSKPRGKRMRNVPAIGDCRAGNANTWLADTLIKLVNGWPASKIDDLMPWAYAKIHA